MKLKKRTKSRKRYKGSVMNQIQDSIKSQQNTLYKKGAEKLLFR